MTAPGLRLLRGGLLLLLVGVLASVGLSIRRPPPAPAPSAAPSGPPAGEPAPAASPTKAATRMGDVVYRNVKGGRESFVLRAKRMSGSEQERLELEEVAAEFSYVSQGEPGTGTIVANRCLYFPDRQEAHFEGHVRVTTADGMQLESEELVYSGQDGTSRSDKPVAFKVRSLAGQAQRMTYQADPGNVELQGDVRVRGSGEGAFEVKSARASLARETGQTRFEEDVVLTRGADVLRADVLTLYGGTSEIDRARAAGNVHVQSRSDALPGMRGARASRERRTGPRDLKCDQLDVNVRPDNTLEEAVASGDDAVLVVLPAPREAGERRTLKGSVLTFRFDEQERLYEVLGQKQAEFVGEPLPPAKGPLRRIRSRNFRASLHPETGATESAEFNKEVLFERGPVEARAERATLNGAESKLALNDEPSLLDKEQGSRLQAETIEVFTQSGDLRARYGVRHTLERRAGRGAGVPGSEAEVTVVSSRLFEYDAKAKSARYLDGALLRSGKSELRAGEIKRTDAGEGNRRLEAAGEVVSLLYPRAKPGEAEQPPLNGRAAAMAYDEGRHELVYKGDVTLQQGEVRTKSSEAVITLPEDGGEMKRLEAFDPVELRQGKTRVATGQRAVYTPGDKTIVVTGEKAEMKDESQQAQGRSLTFFVGEDRILVDGREEARTETILRRKP